MIRDIGVQVIAGLITAALIYSVKVIKDKLKNLGFYSHFRVYGIFSTIFMCWFLFLAICSNTLFSRILYCTYSILIISSLVRIIFALVKALELIDNKVEDVNKEYYDQISNDSD